MEARVPQDRAAGGRSAKRWLTRVAFGGAGRVRVQPFPLFFVSIVFVVGGVVLYERSAAPPGPSDGFADDQSDGSETAMLELSDADDEPAILADASPLAL